MKGIRPISFMIAPILFLGVLSQVSNAQDHPATSARKPNTEKRGIVLPKALKRLEAKYPDDAKAKLIRGIVMVEFVVDQEGKVISPRAIFGHPTLKPAAVEAAKGWEFDIPAQNGQPTKLLGSMTFCFLPSRDFSKSKYTFSFEDCCPRRVLKRDHWCTDSK